MPRLPVYLLVCPLVLATAGPSAAQHARYPRQQPAPAPAELSARVRPSPPATAQAQPAAAPALVWDAALSIDSLRGAVRVEQEQILANLIAHTPDSEVEEKADYYFRLAELYAKQQRLALLRAAEPTATPQHRAQALNSAKMYLLKAVKTFKGLTDNEVFRNYPKLDVALFYYAYTLQSGKYMKEARAVYDKLLKHFPSSKYVPEAHHAFGDYYFASGQLADAEARYKMVLKFPNAAVYPYALYRMGAIHLQLSRNQEALETFFQVVRLARGNASLVELDRAAKRDFVRAYLQVGKVDRAYDAFARVDKATAADLVEQLAELHRASGATERAIAAYRSIVAHDAADPRACSWQYRVAHDTLVLQTATVSQKLGEIEALVKIFQAQKTPDAECRANAAAMSGELAAAYHHEWAKTQNLDTLGAAERLYALHAGAFPDDAAARAAYAEVLWTRADREPDAKRRSERWIRAADAFAALPSDDGARATALAWMNALDISLPVDAKAALAAPRARARTFSVRDGKLVAAVAALSARQPAADAELAQMRLAVALLQRKHGRFDEAVDTLDGFLDQHNGDARAELAALLLLDSLERARRAEDARETAAAMAADTSFVAGKSQLLSRIDRILRKRR